MEDDLYLPNFLSSRSLRRSFYFVHTVILILSNIRLHNHLHFHVATAAFDMPASLSLIAYALLVLLANAARDDFNTCTAQPQSHGGHCIAEQGRTYASAYCSSVLSITTPTLTTTMTSIS